MAYRGWLKRNAMPLALAILLNAAITGLHGQTLKGTILGTITDTTQAAVSGVHVSVTEVNTNFQRTGVSNEEGFYVFANLDPGNYASRRSTQASAIWRGSFLPFIHTPELVPRWESEFAALRRKANKTEWPTKLAAPPAPIDLL